MTFAPEIVLKQCCTSLTAEAKKLRYCVHLWREYVNCRRNKKAVRVSAQRHYDGTVLRSVVVADFYVVNLTLRCAIIRSLF